MSQSSKTRNPSDGNAQALQALLHSLAPDSVSERDGKLNPEAVQKLSNKLKELVGDGHEDSQPRDEQGNLLNEEGLPIIDITEPMNASASDVPPASLSPEYDAPIPLASLSLPEQERRRRERDRILDMLEEEEQRELNKDVSFTPEERQEILRKRKEAAEQEVARIKAAKAMQKKMGKALLQGLSSPREPTMPAEPSKIAQTQVTPTPRKSVKFSDDVVKASEPRQDETQDWGDVIPARLRSNNGSSLMSNARIDAHPMKLHVVERIPGKPKPDELQPDSDDESEPPDSPTLSDSDEGSGFESDGELVDQVDLDFAQQQREITLEYHAKRAKIAETMRFHSLDQDGVAHKTSEESVTQPSRKPAISQFQADRLAASYNASPASQSLGAPAVSGQTLQRGIRMGKLDSDNRLVGGAAGESGSDDETGVQEVMELLKKGEVYNLGPAGRVVHTVPPLPPAASPTPSATTAEVTSAPPPPAARKPPASKFKLARPGHRFSPAVASSPEPPTPPTTEARSSPKLPTPTSEAPIALPSANVMSSTVVEKPPSATPFASVFASPSFPQSRRPQQPPTVVRAADKPAKVSRFLAERM